MPSSPDACSPTAASRRRTLALLAALPLAACSLTRPAPVKQTFLLDPTPPAPVASTKPGTLRLGTFNVAQPYRDRAFVYRTGELAYESDFYSEFFVAPGAMIAQAVGKALTAARVFERVVPSGTAPEEGDLVLEGFVDELVADARQAPASGAVGITFYVSRVAFPSTVVWTKAYRERTPLSGTSAPALAQAWNDSLGRVLAALVADLAAANLAPADARRG